MAARTSRGAGFRSMLRPPCWLRSASRTSSSSTSSSCVFEHPPAHDHRADVDLRAEEPDRRRRRPTTTSLSTAAKTEAFPECIRLRDEEAASRLAIVVAAVERPSAFRTASGGYMPCDIFVDLDELHEELVPEHQGVPHASTSGSQHPGGEPPGRLFASLPRGPRFSPSKRLLRTPQPPLHPSWWRSMGSASRCARRTQRERARADSARRR